MNHYGFRCKMFSPYKPITNYERLISKSPEGLAEWLDAIAPHKKWALFLEGRTWLDWLKQEAN